MLTRAAWRCLALPRAELSCLEEGPELGRGSLWGKCPEWWRRLPLWWRVNTVWLYKEAVRHRIAVEWASGVLLGLKGYH